MDTMAERLIAHLGLVPHPNEGGWFVETYRAKPPLAFAGYDGRRAVSTGIYYLLTPETQSAMHLVASDEMFHFYLGDAVRQLRLHPGGRSETVVIGPDVLAGQALQTVVPAGVWQGARLAPGGRFALMGCTVAPGFDYADYEHGARDELLKGWPDAAEMIRDLTPDSR